LTFWVLSNTVSAGATFKSSLFNNQSIECKAVGTPGSGFGQRENVVEAVERLAIARM